MTDMELRINGRIEVIDYNGGINYKSSIQDINEVGISITIPMKEGKYLPLNKDEKVSIIYYGDKDVYQFEADVLGRTIDVIPIIILSGPHNSRVIQRRNYVRVLILKNIEFIGIDKELAEKNISNIARVIDRKQFKKASLLDLSGGGMRIKTEEKLRLNDSLVIAIELVEDELTVKTRVVRCDLQPDNTNAYGLKFIELGEADRDKIIKYIFQIMREQRKKGLKGD